MMKTTDKEFAIVGQNDNNKMLFATGQFKAKDVKEHFANLKKI